MSASSSAKRYVVVKPGFQMVMELKNGCFLYVCFNGGEAGVAPAKSSSKAASPEVLFGGKKRVD